LSDDQFTVDGTIVEDWASQKSFQKRTKTKGYSSDSDDPGNPPVNFRGEKPKNDTSQSTTDPEASLFRKGSGISFIGHALVDNRHSLIVETAFTQATGKAERTSGVPMIMRVTKRIARLTGRSVDHRMTLGADKN